jgi:hypothetical protein
MAGDKAFLAETLDLQQAGLRYTATAGFSGWLPGRGFHQEPQSWQRRRRRGARRWNRSQLVTATRLHRRDNGQLRIKKPAPAIIAAHYECDGKILERGDVEQLNAVA